MTGVQSLLPCAWHMVGPTQTGVLPVIFRLLPPEPEDLSSLWPGFLAN